MAHRHITITALAGLLSLSLTGCSGLNQHGYTYWSDGYSYSNYQHRNARYQHDNLGPQHYPARRTVRVPKSYHFGENNSPAKHKDRDQQWVNQQAPSSYTIQLKSSKKRSDVARTIHETPKHARTAQIKVDNGSETQHKGLYGSYKNEEQAKAALEKLPESVRQNAKIKSFNSIQKN